ncbi:MAG: hypothetical protein A2Z25_12075 [Planctomycetes bacterium RBG_16_55_9]|nr:MAG: hypothetical protein A2Z25_12075 [Planctomycetes bacterium RBG_16_55_9]
MDKEYIKKLASDPNFIPGVYNYCDRWCERCAFTSRCMNFALSEEHFADPETHDINNKAFWEKLSEIFQLTLEMVKETARDQGIDLDALDLQAGEDECKSIRNVAENHECCLAAESYSNWVTKWFDSAENLFEEKTDELNQQARLGLPALDPAGQASGIEEAINIIRWYQHFIYVKLIRAVQGTLDDFASDSDGSAKVALIAIDRSIGAWGQMYEHFPQSQDDILDVLVHLEKLRRKALIAFPNAMAFIRPGLDSDS